MKDLKAYFNSLNDGDNITVTGDLLNAMESTLNSITELENKNKCIFMVKFLWSTNDDQDTEIELYGNYDNAVKRFNEMIENEKDPDLSWAADAFNGDRFDDENYEFDQRLGTEYMYWSVNKRYEGNFYSTIILTKEYVR